MKIKHGSNKYTGGGSKEALNHGRKVVKGDPARNTVKPHKVNTTDGTAVPSKVLKKAYETPWASKFKARMASTDKAISASSAPELNAIRTKYADRAGDNPTVAATRTGFRQIRLRNAYNKLK